MSLDEVPDLEKLRIDADKHDADNRSLRSGYRQGSSAGTAGTSALVPAATMGWTPLGAVSANLVWNRTVRSDLVYDVWYTSQGWWLV
jgi:hypothetical protein